MNYKQLTAIHAKYKDQKFAILAFPCNQFGNQEPGSHDDIKKFTAKYGVQFDLFAKVKVNGSETHPVFRFLKANTSSMFGGFLKWNFTKFLVNRAGKPTERFAPSSHPNSIIPNIEKLLKDPIPADAAPTVGVDVAAAGQPALAAPAAAAKPALARAASAAGAAPATAPAPTPAASAAAPAAAAPTAAAAAPAAAPAASSAPAS